MTNVPNTYSEYRPKRLAVKLSSKGEQAVMHRHPWIFSNSIQKINKTGETGDLAVVFSKSENKLMGIGLYDRDSDIRIKMLYHGSKPQQIDTAYFRHKIERAYKARQQLLESHTNSYRLLYGESDGFPGLIADVYHEVLVIKLYSGIWIPYFQNLLELLKQISQCTVVVLRLSRKLQSLKSQNLKDGSVIYGQLLEEVVLFREHGIRFSANVIKGHKTGYFLDHRFNRKTVGEMSKGKRVLDVFAYAGGFSVHALAKGASSVTSLDISEQALKVAQFNANLNGHTGTHNILVGDAFKKLKQLQAEGKTYDIVVIDPPSFAKRQSEVELARKKYIQLAKLGAGLTEKGGVLVLASCSSRVTKEDFTNIVTRALESVKANFTLFKTTAHDVDHPIGFPEAAYLKTLYFKKR